MRDVSRKAELAGDNPVAVPVPYQSADWHEQKRRFDCRGLIRAILVLTNLARTGHATCKHYLTSINSARVFTNPLPASAAMQPATPLLFHPFADSPAPSDFFGALRTWSAGLPNIFTANLVQPLSSMIRPGQSVAVPPKPSRSRGSGNLPERPALIPDTFRPEREDGCRNRRRGQSAPIISAARPA